MDAYELFHVHLANTRALDRAYDIVAKECREAIARRDRESIDALTRTATLLFGARMENRLLRLLYEPDAFSDEQRARILSGTIEKAWTEVVREAYAQRRNLKPTQVPGNLAFSDKARYDELIRLIREDLAPLITIRNTLAHGQWHRALTEDRQRVSEEKMKLLRTTRLWHIVIKANILRHLVLLLHDLAVTRWAFERDFDKHWADLQSAKHRLELNNYADWERRLQIGWSKRPQSANPPQEVRRKRPARSVAD